MKPCPVTPVASGSLYTFQAGDILFGVDAALGGRIVTFAFAGRNILTGPSVDPNNHGSTFWSSPQSDWGWPPPPEIDSTPYAAKIEGPSLSLMGMAAPALGLAVEKRFSMDSEGVVNVAYTLHNHGNQGRQVAAWEISRVASGGLTFFPMGEGELRKGFQDLLLPKITDGVAWFAYDATTITADQKLFADGQEGWIAHVDGDLLLVKSFPDSPAEQSAPGEAEIEIYANAAHTYVEVENQGALVNLPAGAASTWTVRWTLCKLERPALTISPALVELVRGLVK